MKINVKRHLLNFEGKDILDDKNKPVEARTVIANALVSEDQDHRLTGEKKTQAFQIGLKLWGDKEVDLTVDQLAFIKERVGIFHNALIFGRICELLEGKTEEKNVR